MKTLELYYKLFVAPQPLHSVGEYCETVALLLIPWFLLFWMIAFIQNTVTRPSPEDPVEWADTTTRAGLAWAWSALLLSALITVDICIVWYLHRIPEWSAVTPHFTLILIGILVAFLHCQALTSRWKRMQLHLHESMHESR